MKRILLLGLLIIAALSVSAQTAIIDKITIDCGKVVASDTIIAFPNEQIMGQYFININYTTANADDATIDVVYANDRGDWAALSVAGWPFPLDVTANTDILTGIASVKVIKDGIAAQFCGVRYKKGSVTDGEIDITRTFIAPYRRVWP